LLVSVCPGLHAADGAATTTRDTLAYKDGDRVQGKLIAQQGDTIVFKSDRFGELRVPASDAVVIKGEKSAPAAGEAAAVATHVEAAGIHPAPKTHAEQAEEERVTIWEKFSPSVLTARVRNFFGPWHGRFAFSDEVVSDTASRNNVALEGKLQRKLARDEIELAGHYDYAKTNEVPTTDLLKATGSWRHDFNLKEFTQYRPSVEWNRASTRNGVLNKYLLLHQEIGVGLTVLAKPSRRVRLGVSENLFDIWNSAPTADHASRGVVSSFEEIELTLPWRMNLSQRGVWYPVPHRRDGFEDRVELNKKLTETLSVAVRHEIRRNNPDGSAQDYARLKLLFGLDF